MVGKKITGALCLSVLAACAAACWRSLSVDESLADGQQELWRRETEETEAGTGRPALSGEIRLAGSTSMARLAGALAEGFMEAYPDVIVTVEFTGSAAGIEAVASQSADIGNSSRMLSEQEKATGVAENLVARDGIGICVRRNNPVRDLTGWQLAQIYTGEINNWSEVGGEDLPIVVVGREAGSGTRSAFETLTGVGDSCVYTNVLDSAGAVMAKVAATPGAIGYISLGVADDSVKILTLEGAEPTVENVGNGVYWLNSPCIMATKGEISDQNRLIQAWFDYVLGEEGRKITKEAGLAPVQ